MRHLTSPHELYISGEFRALRESLMHERVDAKGLLRCEHCGEPIILDADCIAHHITEVTSANLNNPEITLNPANIMLVHLRCHNEIHERFGYSLKKVYLVWGSPCAGKDTFVRENKGRNDLVINIDNIWQALTGEKYFKPDSLKNNVFGLYREALEQVKTKLGNWNRAFVIVTMPRRAERERFCRTFGAEPIYIEATKEDALMRLFNDEERVLVVDKWKEYINKFFAELEDDK